MDSNIEIGKVLRTLRKDKTTLTLQQLDEKTKLGATYLSELERGLRNPTINVLERYSAALGLSLNELFSTIAMNTALGEKMDSTITEDDLRFFKSYRKLTQVEKDALLVIVNRLTKS